MPEPAVAGGVHGGTPQFAAMSTIDRETASEPNKPFFDAYVVPGAIILVFSLCSYSAIASMILRPNLSGRFMPVFILYAVGLLLGGFFPRLARWAYGGISRRQTIFRRGVILAILLYCVATIVPGLHLYTHSEPLRGLNNLGLGFSSAMSFAAFFSRFPTRLQGRWYGFITGAGVILCNILIYLAGPWPADHVHHPFLATVYYIQTSLFIVLTVLLAKVFVFARECPLPPRAAAVTGATQSIVTAAEANRSIVILLAASFLIYFLNGVLGTRMTMLSADQPEILFAGTVIVVFGLYPLAAGWLVDTHPVRLFNQILPICCWLFILSPSFVALSNADGLRMMLQPLASAAQFIILITSTVMVTRLVPEHGVFFACCVSGSRIGIGFGHLARSWLMQYGVGVTLLFGIAVAFVISGLLRKIHIPSARADRSEQENDFNLSLAENSDPALPPEAHPDSSTDSTLDPGNVPAGGVEDFLSSQPLTRREKQVATLLLEGNTVLCIADSLGISDKTVKKHTATLYRKFGVSNRHQLYRFYIEGPAAPTPATDEIEAMQSVGDNLNG